MIPVSLATMKGVPPTSKNLCWCVVLRGMTSFIILEVRFPSSMLALLEGAERQMARTFGGFGKSRTSDATEVIKEYIEKVGITTRKQLLQRFYRDIDAFTMSGVEDTLRQMGFITVEPVANNPNDKVYRHFSQPKIKKEERD